MEAKELIMGFVGIWLFTTIVLIVCGHLSWDQAGVSGLGPAILIMVGLGGVKEFLKR